jgi:hypothetical protein
MAHNKALAERLRHDQLRHELLRTIYYEAKRSGLDPDLKVISENTPYPQRVRGALCRSCHFGQI